LQPNIHQVLRLPPHSHSILSDQPTFSQIGADEAWSASQGENVTIAIIDGGARYTHESLQPSYRGSGSGGNVDHDYNWIDFAYHNKEVGWLSVCTRLSFCLLIA